jgi:hypothetical protein
VSNGKVPSLRAQGTWSAGEGDGKQQFLADLRRLRDAAALEFEELAARAHYPSDVLKEAESGPGLPTLPILAAYVRACDGDVPEWEERWRRLGLAVDGDPGLPVRAAGASAAAVAGARAGVSVAPPDAYDPDLIRAALRGSHQERPRRTASPAASRHVEPEISASAPTVPESPAPWSGGASWDETERWDAATSAGWSTDAPTGWDGFQPKAEVGWDDAATDPSEAPSSGNHHASQPPDPAITETVSAAQAEAIRRDPFSTEWLQDSEFASPPEPESGWQAEPAEAEAAPDDWFTPRESASREQTWAAADTEPSPEATDAWFTPRERSDDGLPQPAKHDAALEQEQTLVTGFWTPSNAASAPTEVQTPAPPPVENRTIPRASWTTPAPAETSAGDPPGAADKTTPMLTQAGAGVPPRPMAEPAVPPRPMAEPALPSRPMAEAASSLRTIAGPAVPPGPVVPPSGRRADRLYPVRLLVVIVVAALIGSVLVLLLR